MAPRATKKSDPAFDASNPFHTLRKELSCFKAGHYIDDNFEEVVFPTGSIVLDDVLRLRGIPFNGRLIHIHGNPHGGKSTIGYGCIRQYQRSNIGTGYVAIWDWEKTCTPMYLRGLGVDTSKVQIFRPNNTREALKDAYLLAKSGVRLHMIDSIAMIQNAAEAKEILNGDALKARVGSHAKMVSEFFTEYMAIAADLDLSTIAINQTRARIDTSSEGQRAMKYPSMTNLAYDLPGGRKPRFLASIMLEVDIAKEVYGAKDEEWYLMEPIPKVKTNPIVNKVNLRVLKNKVNDGGFRKGTIWIRPGRGVDDWISVRELASNYDLITYVAGKGYRVGSEDDPIKFYKDKDEARTALVLNPDMDVLTRLREQVSAAVLGDNDGSKTTLTTEDMLVAEDVGGTFDVGDDEDIEAPVTIKGKKKSIIQVADDDEDDGL